VAECSKCGKRKTVINLEYMKEEYCGECFINLYEKRVRKSIRKHGMIQRNDKIALAVSGGKDSLSMANVLHKLNLDVVAITIDEGICGYRDNSIEKVRNFMQEKEIPLHIYSFKEEIGVTVDEVAEEHEEQSCSYCGVFRRKLMNKAARELGCDKIATGHNLDDEVQTVLMNLIRSEPQRLARMGPVTGLKDHGKFVPRIKPLRRCSEKEDAVYALVNGIDFDDGKCLYINSSSRLLTRECLNKMELENPGTKFSILSSYDKMLPALREYYRGKSGDIGECGKCGEPTSSDECKACRMIRNLI